jgi:serine O-acetyltransferase
MNWIEMLRVDLLRYPKNAFLREQSIWAITIYRMGQAMNAWPHGFTKRVIEPLYWFSFRIIETFTGCSFSKAVRIGSGLRIHHFGGIFIHDSVQIGRNCTLRQGVTLGNRHPGGGVPVVGDDVEFGAYAQVLGAVKIGNRAKIGAMAVVIRDVPEGATVVGIPARVVKLK